MAADAVPFTTDHLIEHLRFEASAVVDRGIVTRGQRLVVRDLLLRAAEEVERLRDEVSDCPICTMVATDRDDALNEADALRADLDRIRTLADGIYGYAYTVTLIREVLDGKS